MIRAGVWAKLEVRLGHWKIDWSWIRGGQYNYDSCSAFRPWQLLVGHIEMAQG